MSVSWNNKAQGGKQACSYDYACNTEESIFCPYQVCASMLHEVFVLLFYFSLKILVMLMMPSVGEMAMILTAIDCGLVIHYIILIMLMRPPGTVLIPLSVLI